MPPLTTIARRNTVPDRRAVTLMLGCFAHFPQTVGIRGECEKKELTKALRECAMGVVPGRKAMGCPAGRVKLARVLMRGAAVRAARMGRAFSGIAGPYFFGGPPPNCFQ